MVEFNQQYAHTVAQSYIGTSRPLKRLGGGISGFVYMSPDARSALKIHQHGEGYTTEVSVYKRLALLRTPKIRDLNIPRMRNHSDRYRLIQMDFVNAPYLLDFAGATFKKPDFTDDVMNDWHRNLRYRFGPNVSVAYEVWHALRKLGIYYLDFRPSNLNLTGLPGLLPPEPSTEDDDDWD